MKGKVTEGGHEESEEIASLLVKQYSQISNQLGIIEVPVFLNWQGGDLLLERCRRLVYGIGKAIRWCQWVPDIRMETADMDQ